MTASGRLDPVAPPLHGPVAFAQSWLSVFFLHWAVDPADVAPLLPRGVRPDTFDGATYLGLVPFRMAQAGIGPRPAVPYLGTFLECNVRLYSVDDDGRHGVVFRSLDASRFVTSMAARTGYRLPYTWALMRVRQRGTRWEWIVRRRIPADNGHLRLVVETGEPTEPSDLEVFYTARWGLHSSVAGRTIWTPNEHEPWPLRTARVVSLDQDLTQLAGFDLGAEPTQRALFAPAVRTRFGLPQVIA